MPDARKRVQLVLVENERLACGEPVLGKPKSRTLIEPDHLLHVIQETMKFLDRGIGLDPGALFRNEQGYPPLSTLKKSAGQSALARTGSRRLHASDRLLSAAVRHCVRTDTLLPLTIFSSGCS